MNVNWVELFRYGYEFVEQFLQRIEASESKDIQKIVAWFTEIGAILQELIAAYGTKPIDGVKVTSLRSTLKIQINNAPKNASKILEKRELGDLFTEFKNLLPLLDQENPSLEKFADLEGKLKGLRSRLAEMPTAPRTTNNPTSYPVDRRSIVLQTLVLAASSFAGSFTSSYINKPTKVKWKMICFPTLLTSKSGDVASKTILYKAPRLVAELVKELSDGDFEIDIDDNPTKEIDILENIKEGNAECGYNSVYNSSSWVAWMFFNYAIPFGLNPQEQNAWLYYVPEAKRGKPYIGSETTYMQQHYIEAHQVIPFPAGGTGGQMGGWFKKEVTKPEDFKGLKIRVPGIGRAVLLQKPFEAAVQTDKDKIYNLSIFKSWLCSDELDALEWVGPYDDLQLGLQNCSEKLYYYKPGWWEPSTTYELLVNNKAYEKLTDRFRRILKTACHETHFSILNAYEQYNSEEFERLENKIKSGEIKNVVIKDFDKSILVAAEKATISWLDNNCSDQTSLDIYKQWKDLRRRVRNWNSTNRVENYP